MATKKTERQTAMQESAFTQDSKAPRVAELRQSLGLTRKLFSRLTGYSERAIAEWESGKEQSDPSRQRLIEIHRLHQALIAVIPQDQVGRWLLQPNQAFAGLKPLEVIERGEIDRIWRFLYGRPPESEAA